MDIVTQIFNDYKDAVYILEKNNEISLKNSMEGNFRKTLILSCASYFEHKLTADVVNFVHDKTKDQLISYLVKNKVTNRQYHTWFSWKENNANTFFSMFGDSFKAHMSSIIKEDEALAQSIKDFMEIGRDRNRMVHQDFGSFFVEKTAQEIYQSCISASKFVYLISEELLKCSDALSN